MTGGPCSTILYAALNVGRKPCCGFLFGGPRSVDLIHRYSDIWVVLERDVQRLIQRDRLIKIGRRGLRRHGPHPRTKRGNRDRQMDCSQYVYLQRGKAAK